MAYTPTLPLQSPMLDAGDAFPDLKASRVESRRISDQIFRLTICLTLACQLAFALFSSMSSYLDFQRFSPPSVSAQWQYFIATREFCWLLSTPVLAWLISETKHSWKHVALYMAPVALLGFLITSLFVHTMEHWQTRFFSPDSEANTIAECLSRSGFWVGELASAFGHIYILGIVGFAIRFWIKSTVAERKAEKLNELVDVLSHKMLYNRLQPHFLFNTLNTISALTIAQPEKAREVIGRLGDLLRNSIESMGVYEIELQREYELVKDYLEIQKIRFGERLEYSLELPQQLKKRMIPAFLLQPLVENSVKHGLARSNDCETNSTVNICVSSTVHEERMIVAVSDTGEGTDTPPDSLNENLGLGLTRERIRLQYGEQGDVTVSSRQGEGFTVRLSIPVGEAEPTDA